MVYLIIIGVILGIIWYCAKSKKATPIARPQAEQVHYYSAKSSVPQPFLTENANEQFQQVLQELLKDVVILDTETTGLTKKSEVVEISIIDVHGNVLLDTLVKPKTRMRADSKAAEIHGITNDMLKDAPTWAMIHDQVCEIIKNRTVLIYNADFDTRIMQQSAEKYGLEMPDYNPECAMLLYGFWEGSASNRGDGYKWHKLQSACETLNIEIEGTAHRALSDCLSTLNLAKSLIGRELQPRKGF